MAFTLGMVSYRLLQIQMHVKLFIVKRVAVGRLPEQVWVFTMGCISTGKSQRTEELSNSLTTTSGRAAQVEGCGSGGLTTHFSSAGEH